MLSSLDHPTLPLDQQRAHLDEIAALARKESALIGSAEDGAKLIANILNGRYGYEGDRLTYDDPRNADLIQVMDSETNSTSFANLQGFFPPFTSKLTGGAYAGSQLMSGFAKAAAVTQISPLNAKNWSTADETDLIIPTMMKSLMTGANFQSTVAKANTELQSVLNTGQES